ncbi:MAG: carbohydrate ABC transporter permease [Aggregatilineales bacterium]
MQNKVSGLIENIFIYTFLIAISLFMMLPFLWMLSTSFKLPEDVFGLPPQIIPQNPTLQSYEFLLTEKNILRIVLNTFLIASGATIIRLLFCAMAGFAFAKYRFPGQRTLFAFVLGTMLIPGAVTLIPLFILLRNFGMIDTLWSLILPGAANAFGIFFLRQYLLGLNTELLEAARIDGAGEFGIFFRIILPIIRPGLISLGLIFFMASWNDYFGPLVFLKSPENFTLPLAIRTFEGAAGLTAYNTQMAMAVISIVPLLIIFLVFQNRIVDGITAGAVKG